MEDKVEQIVKLALDYMELMEEEDVKSDDIVVSIINEVHSIITDSDQPLLKLSYKEDIGDENYELAESIAPKERTGKKESTSLSSSDEERQFPNLPEELEKDINEALQYVYDVIGDVAYALEVSEEDRAALAKQNDRLQVKNKNFLEQAKLLYKRNEYLDLHVRDLEETIDDIFSQGDKAVETEDSTEESKEDKENADEDTGN